MTEQFRWYEPPLIKDGPWQGWREMGWVDETALSREAEQGYDPSQLKPRRMETFPSGAVRDDHSMKPRFDFIDPFFLTRLAEHLRAGAEKYGPFNWTKGIPSQRYAASLLRHIFAYLSGDDSEDHIAAAAFNLMGLARNEGTELDDLFEW